MGGEPLSHRSDKTTKPINQITTTNVPPMAARTRVKVLQPSAKHVLAMAPGPTIIHEIMSALKIMSPQVALRQPNTLPGPPGCPQ